MSVSHGVVTDRGSHWHVVRYKNMSDGTVQEGCHIIYKEAMEWRAAEFGIPASDLNTLLDIVLMEPYLTDAEIAQGPSLLNATTIAEAREAHLARIVSAKLRLRVSTQSKAERNILAIVPGANGKQEVITFLDAVRAGSLMDDDAVSEKKKLVRKMRRSQNVVERSVSRVEKLRRENKRGEDNG